MQAPATGRARAPPPTTQSPLSQALASRPKKHRLALDRSRPAARLRRSPPGGPTPPYGVIFDIPGGLGEERVSKRPASWPFGAGAAGSPPEQERSWEGASDKKDKPKVKGLILA